MKVLVLAIFDKTERNDTLMKIHQSHLKNNRFIQNNSIDVFFITFDETLCQDYKLEDNILLIKGKEDYMNILSKTIKALDYFINDQNKNYDYLVRTNISSVFNFKLLYEYLNNMPRQNLYVGGIFYYLGWLDEKFGITRKTMKDYELFNIGFFQGTCIILSSDVFQFLLNRSHRLQYHIIDDVAIALLIRTYIPNAYLTTKNLPKVTVIDENNKIYDRDSILFRHKTLDDKLDIEYLGFTYKFICENNNEDNVIYGDKE